MRARRPIMILVTLLVLLAAVTAATTDRASAEGPPTTTVTSQSAGTVRIVDFAFNPSALSVSAGTTVTWMNTGMQTHTTTADGGLWNSGLLRPGATFSQTFATPGAFSFHCMIHPSMTGTITVTGASNAAASGSATVASSALASVSASYPAGWNLVAAPGGTVLTGAVGPLYTFRAGDTAYETVGSNSPVSAGAGYWAYFSAPMTEAFAAAPAQPMSIQLPAGSYVMVGNSGGTTMTFNGADQLLTYDPIQGYQPASILKPGQGAWAFSASGAVLTIRVG